LFGRPYAARAIETHAKVYYELNPLRLTHREGDWRDALISEAALRNDLLLVTADVDLHDAHIAAGGSARLHRPGSTLEWVSP
jgi:predicted nuclease of predicted toxin-antitoxin system